MGAAILLIALFVRVRALWLFLAIADGLETIAWYAQLHQEFAGGGCAPVAECEVIFGRTALVAVTFDGDYERGIGGQQLLPGFSIRRERSAAIFPQLALVIVKVNI